MNERANVMETETAAARFVRAIAEPNQPATVLTALEDLVDATLGVTLFTTMTLDTTRGVARRNYTNHPDAYPAGGEKTIEPNAWTRQVAERHEIFVANSIDEIAAVFPDHELILSLGCESCLNLPIVVGGHAIGTLNCLNGAGHFTPDRVTAAKALQLPGALALLMVRTFETGDDKNA